MSDRILTFIDIHHEDDDGVVDEIDLIEAIRKLVPVLHESKDNRDDNQEILISIGANLGGDNSPKHVTMLVGSIRAIQLIDHQIESAKHMGMITHAGNLKELLEIIQSKLNKEEEEKEEEEDTTE